MTIDAAGKLDPAIVAALYMEHAEELRSFLIGVLRSPDLAGEALQSTFVRAMECGHTSHQETRKAWLFRVAFHEAMALKRRQKQQDRSLRQLAGNARPGVHRPEEALIRWEAVERVKQALESLPEAQRDVVRQRIYGEKTFAKIAEESGLPLGTVLTRMRLALKRLQSQLHKDHSANE